MSVFTIDFNSKGKAFIFTPIKYQLKLLVSLVSELISHVHGDVIIRQLLILLLILFLLYSRFFHLIIQIKTYIYIGMERSILDRSARQWNNLSYNLAKMSKTSSIIEDIKSKLPKRVGG